MRNSKQWAKGVMAIIIGALPIVLSGYAHETWYFILLTFCSLFVVLGVIAVFQLFIYTILFPHSRNSFVKTLFGLAIVLSLSIPYFWIRYNESNPEQMLKSNFEIAEAHITQIVPEGGNYRVNYEYEVSGKQYKTSKILKKNPETSTFNIKYLPFKPEINEPAEYK